MNPAKPSKFRCFSEIFSKIRSKFGVFEAVIEHDQSKISSSPGNAKHNIERSAAKLCGIISKSLEQIWADTSALPSKRPPHGPRKRWKDPVKHDLAAVSIGMNEWLDTADNRSEWRTRCQDGV